MLSQKLDTIRSTTGSAMLTYAHKNYFEMRGRKLDVRIIGGSVKLSHVYPHITYLTYIHTQNITHNTRTQTSGVVPYSRTAQTLANRLD